jgi:zinc/manganese transport system substrate-binding protein
MTFRNNSARSRQWPQHMAPLMKSFLLLLVLSCWLAACGTESQGGQSATRDKLTVVAAENFWGSIAAQLGGEKVAVTSIISAPSGDPHEYESTPNDARAMASAKYVILNGAGYDDWGKKLIEANPVEGRKVFHVAQLVSVKEGDNPHLWYNPAYIEQAANQITADYKALDSSNASYYDQQRGAFKKAMQPYNDLIATIKKDYRGTKIGVSESIYVYMANALGLTIITPREFYDAEAQSSDPPTSVVAEVNRQIKEKEIRVFILNVQVLDNTVKALQQQVEQQKIPVVQITETVNPPGDKFQDWQYAQLAALQKALSQK